MNPLPILLVDKKGIIGDALCQNRISRSLVVYVSQRKPKLDGIFFVAYDRDVPVIPDNIYSRIFVVDDGAIKKKHLLEFLKKAKKDNSSLVFIISLSKINSFYKKVKVQLGGSKVVVLGDIVSKNTYPLLIYNAIKFGRIKITGDGLSYTYPVFLEDVVSGIIDAAFYKNTKASIFYLFPKHAPTELSLARMIQKANPSVQVDFTKQYKKEPEIKIPPNGEYILPNNYSLEKKIRELKIESLMARHFNTSTLLSINPELVEWVNKDSFNINISLKERKFFSIRTLFLALFILLMLPFILTLVLSLLGFGALENTKIALEKGSIANARISAGAAKTFFLLAKRSSVLFLAQGKIIGQEKNLDIVTKNIDLGSDLSQMAIYLTDGWKMFSEVFAGTSISPENDFTKATWDIKSAMSIFRQNEAEGNLPSDIKLKTKSVDNLIRIAENTMDYTQGIFGFNGKRVYLILFQNNMELRPGGGFIGSYGLLTFDSGKMVDFSIHDVYDADGQLRGHVEPPYPIRRYLHLPHLYLRDSNFDVDFAKGASSSAILLNAETGQMVDGVIGIDVSFVKSILEATGPIFVADYKETVTATNLFKLTESHAEKNSFPGSRQKKDFLRSLFSAIQSKLSAKNLPYLEIAKSIDEAIVQKHLVFAFSDKGLHDLFALNGWSSVLWDAPVDTRSNSINDFLGINEANIGVNKANYFVKTSLSQNINISEGVDIRESLKIKYENPNNGWPGGDYINYLRIILPLNSTISSISFDGVYQDIVSAITDPLIYEAKDFVAPLALELERYNQSGKTIYGFLVNVKAGTSKEIKIEYELPQKLSFEGSDSTYSLHIFKQPGVDSYPYSFSLSYPKGLRIIRGSPSYSLDLAIDKELKIDFAQREVPSGASQKN